MLFKYLFEITILGKLDLKIIK